jgi:hypothetical protein
VSKGPLGNGLVGNLSWASKGVPLPAEGRLNRPLPGASSPTLASFGQKMPQMLGKADSKTPMMLTILPDFAKRQPRVRLSRHDNFQTRSVRLPGGLSGAVSTCLPLHATLASAGGEAGRSLYRAGGRIVGRGLSWAKARRPLVRRWACSSAHGKRCLWPADS